MSNGKNNKTFETSKHDRGFRIKFWILWIFWNLVLFLQPKNPQALFHLGNALAAQGRRHNAIATWKKAFKLNPFHRKIQINLATGLLADGKADEALVCLQKAMLTTSLDLQLLRLLACAQQATDQMTAALSSYRKCAELDPQSSTAKSQLGVAFLKAGQLSSAIEYLEQAQAMDPVNHACAKALKIARARLAAQTSKT